MFRYWINISSLTNEKIGSREKKMAVQIHRWNAMFFLISRPPNFPLLHTVNGCSSAQLYVKQS